MSITPSLDLLVHLRDQPPFEKRLYPGALIGRTPGAQLYLDDPRISEAHAFLSLRGRDLHLLGLRGSLKSPQGRYVSELKLPPKPGFKVGLTDDISLEIAWMTLPETVLALEGLGPKPLELSLPEISLSVGATPWIAGYHPDARAWIWCSGGIWLIRVGEDEQPLEAGQSWELGLHTARVTAVPIEQAATSPTQTAQKFRPPLHLKIAKQETEVLVEGSSRSLRLTENSALLLRAVAEQTLHKSPAHWEELAMGIWGKRNKNLQSNWYVNIGRLKEKLRKAKIYEDLIQSDSCGSFWLDLRADIDTVELLESPLLSA